jgi:hypothetical protein
MNGVLAQQNKARASESVGDGTLYLSTPSTPSTLSTSTQKHLPAAGRIQHRLTPHSLLRTATGAFRTGTRLHANGAPSGVLSAEVSLVHRAGLGGGVEV